MDDRVEVVLLIVGSIMALYVAGCKVRHHRGISLAATLVSVFIAGIALRESMKTSRETEKFDREQRTHNNEVENKLQEELEQSRTNNAQLQRAADALNLANERLATQNQELIASRQVMQQSAVSTYATAPTASRLLALKETEHREKTARVAQRPRLIFYLTTNTASAFGSLYRPVLRVDTENHAHLGLVVKNIGELPFANGWINVAAEEPNVWISSDYARNYSRSVTLNSEGTKLLPISNYSAGYSYPIDILIPPNVNELTLRLMSRGEGLVETNIFQTFIVQREHVKAGYTSQQSASRNNATDQARYRSPSAYGRTRPTDQSAIRTYSPSRDPEKKQKKSFFRKLLHISRCAAELGC